MNTFHSFTLVICFILINFSTAEFSDKSNKFLRMIDSIDGFNDCGYVFNRKWEWICKKNKQTCGENEEERTGLDFESTCRFRTQNSMIPYHNFFGSVDFRARCYCKHGFVRKHVSGPCIKIQDCPGW